MNLYGICWKEGAAGEQTTQNGITYIPMKIKFDVHILIHEMLQIENYRMVRQWDIVSVCTDADGKKERYV